MSIIYIIQSLLLIAGAPLFVGSLRRLKAVLRGYKGAPVLQPYYELMKLFSKGRVLSGNSSFITSIAPAIVLAASILLAFTVPVAYIGSDYGLGNIFVIIFLMAILKFMTVLIGLDSASAFGGMGGSRELFISMFAEPIGFLTAAFLYFEAGSFNIIEITYINSRGIAEPAAHIMAAVAFLLWIAAENTRIPVDNPETHLELTMIHEAMLLDLSGRDLAYFELSTYLKLTVSMALFVNAFIPFGIAASASGSFLLTAFVLFVVKMLIMLSMLAVTETIMAKFRLFRAPELLATSFCFALTAIAIVYLH
ncbi:respiratory chain complex I subunit 1 family protein [Parasporobacterium paucivorans]|uniref:Formate hydrogenlyase subunit 4 n=1 Tax=Parasporobacterium paucivorans DSM 15970 TaxID=1122934 RepID=A0A1M6FD22_9FIRM|nr:NADH-quinone oxidoreductase subunit H [Parasporobacterium paucivorans]SHI95545.1 Formate hydrogenlyase subunit 4 [Parasporobacterium paucivorans DSM 15970]